MMIVCSRTMISALILIVGLAGTARSGPFEDGTAAYKEKDYATALRLWRQLAEEGEAAAQNNVGFMYRRGLGLPAPNLPEAARWYRLAADQGHARAQHNLGLLYAEGLGVERNLIQAYLWFNRAALGAPDVALSQQAVSSRDLAAQKMTPAQLAEVKAGAGSARANPTPRDQYAAAFELFRQGKYDAAELAMRQFVDAYPQSALAGQAQYWLGETFYARNNHSAAAAEFKLAFERYPQGVKAADSLFKFGLALANLDRKPESCAAFARFQGDYPGAPDALKQRVEEERRRLVCLSPAGAAASQSPPSASAPPAMDSNEVMRLQQALTTAGFYRMAVDGLYGPGTEAAVRSWQQAIGQPATGYPTELQLKRLRADDARTAASSAPPQAATGSAVKLIKEGGAYKVPALINGVLPLLFVVDSGASDVSIPPDAAATMLRMGVLSNDDFTGERTYTIADGSKVKYRGVRIRQIKVGDKVIENVQGHITNGKAPLLLGQSFLNRLKRVSFDYSQGLLVLE